MNQMSRKWLLVLGLFAQLLAVGCSGGGDGGGLFGLFGGGGDSGIGDVLGSLASGGGDLLGGGSSGGGGIDPIEPPGVAIIHHPEPASLALFGGGLAGLACLSRRRKTRKSTR